VQRFRYANIEKELSRRVGLKKLWWDRFEDALNFILEMIGTEKCAGSFKSVLED